jgi:tetratricopeptide (TPR) repeat protein
MMTAVAYSQTQTQQPAQYHLHFLKADEALKSGNVALAEREIRAVLELDRNNSEARAKLGFVLYMQGKWEEAAENLQAVLKSQPHLANAQAVLGMCRKRLGRPVEARKLLEDALPHLAQGALQKQTGLELAEILYQTGDLDQAVPVAGILLSTNPNDVDVLYTAARVYADLANRSRDALALAAPDAARTHQLMAEFLINRGDAHAAIDQYHKALELSPALGGVHSELGEAILLDSRQPSALDAAEKEFLAASAENPADANAEYRLGTIYSLRKDYKIAIEHYSRSLHLQPANAYVEQEIGWASFKIGDTDKALEHLLAAKRLDPLLPITCYHLGTIYRELGREADARREFEAFAKLQGARREIDQLYLRTRPAFEETDSQSHDTPNN